jgi:hypothetical protein
VEIATWHRVEHDRARATEAVRQGKIDNNNALLSAAKELVLVFEAFEFVTPGWLRFDKLAQL